MTCPVKIRPFPNEIEIQCKTSLLRQGAHTEHAGGLSDYAYPGSYTEMTWQDDDRRCFTGDWVECPVQPCTLPANHRGNHAP